MHAPRIPQATFPGVKRHVCVCLLLVTGVLFVYGAVGGHEFLLYDDTIYVTENPRVRTGLGMDNIVWAMSTFHAANWHPVTWLSHMLDWQLFGDDAGWHHRVNLLVHMLNSLLVYGVMGNLTGQWAKSAFIALTFSVHPLHVESVAWVAERKDLLCALFWLLTTGAYIRYVRRPAAGRYLTVLLFFALSLMAKPMAVTLPFVLLLLDFWPLGRFRSDQTRKLNALPVLGGGVREKLPLMALSLALSIATLAAQERSGAVGSWSAFPLDLRAANAVCAYAQYLGKAFWPSGLSVLYPFPESIAFPLWFGAALLLATVSGLAIVQMRERPFFLTGWLWYAGTLVPVIGWVQVGQQARADRYTYLPLLGIWIILAWGLPSLLGRFAFHRRLIGLIVPAWLVCLAIAARGQVGHWKDNVTLFERAVAVTSENFAAHTNLALAYDKRGEREKAQEHLERALVIRPGYAKAHNNLAVMLQREGRVAEAIAHYRRALEADPRLVQAQYNLGRIYLEQGETVRALKSFEAAAAADPGFIPGHMATADILAEQGAWPAAAEHYRQVLRTDPVHVPALQHWGNVLLLQGQPREAAAKYTAALRIDPGNADLHNNMGIALIHLGHRAQSVSHFSQALRIDPENAEIRRNLERARQRHETPQAGS